MCNYNSNNHSSGGCPARRRRRAKLDMTSVKAAGFRLGFFLHTSVLGHRTTAQTSNEPSVSRGCGLRARAPAQGIAAPGRRQPDSEAWHPGLRSS